MSVVCPSSALEHPEAGQGVGSSDGAGEEFWVCFWHSGANFWALRLKFCVSRLRTFPKKHFWIPAWLRESLPYINPIIQGLNGHHKQITPILGALRVLKTQFHPEFSFLLGFNCREGAVGKLGCRDFGKGLGKAAWGCHGALLIWCVHTLGFEGQAPNSSILALAFSELSQGLTG